MALKAVVDTLDDIAEGLREEYVETDGKFVLQVESVNGMALEDVSGLKSSLGKERGAKEAAEKALKAFAGIDPEAAKDAIAKVEELGNFDPEKDVDKLADEKFKAREKQLLEKHREELTKKDDRTAHLQDVVDKVMRRSHAIEAITKADGNPKLLTHHVLETTRLRERDDGSFVAEVLDGEGNVRIGDAQGNAMTFDQLVAEMKQSDDFAGAFKGTGKSGGGTPPSGGPGGSGPKPTTKDARDMSVKEKTDYISEHGEEDWTKKVSDDYAKPRTPPSANPLQPGAGPA